MNKRGQFYLIIVIVLALVIYGVTYQSNTIQESKTFEDFHDISQNYLVESKKIINNNLQKSPLESPLVNLDIFTISFLQYAKARDPNLELLYIYRDDEENKIFLQNYLGENVDLNYNLSIPGANDQVIQEVTIEVGGQTYTYQVPVSLGEFGSEWYGAEVPQEFDLSIGGIIHKFDLSDNSEDFKVIIRTETDAVTLRCDDVTCTDVS
ncbi:MAG: hypothetical protein ABIH25_05295 [Candidatus Woesearchaeota archaeon]